MTPYEEIAESIVQKHMQVLGKTIALKRARSAGGIGVDENGAIKTLGNDPVATLERLLTQYQELLGPTALSFARDAARPILKKNSQLLIPAALKV